VAPAVAAGLAACGNGFAAYPDALAQALAAQGLAQLAEGALADILPHARELALLGAAALAAGQGVPADQAQPLYLRNKVAYTQSERQAMNAGGANR
jgi:tRNA threonylcarbamoyladenosine biosynthesis protein TsaB